MEVVIGEFRQNVDRVHHLATLLKERDEALQGGRSRAAFADNNEATMKAC